MFLIRCSLYLQHTPLSSKLKWFPGLAFCVENAEVEQITFLFTVLTLLVLQGSYSDDLIFPDDSIDLRPFGSALGCGYKGLGSLFTRFFLLQQWKPLLSAS